MLYDQDDENSYDQSEVVRKILSIFNNYFDADVDEILEFTHSLSTSGEEKFVTIHPTKDGDIAFCVLTPEQLDMVQQICEFSHRSIEEVIPELAEDGDIPTMIINPRSD